MPPTQQKTVDITKLDDEQKAELLRELEAERISKAETMLAVRNDAMKTFMADRDHLRDCPTGRTEMYGAERPADPRKGIGPAPVTVVRCQECGGSTVLDESYEAAVARLEAMIETEEEVEV